MTENRDPKMTDTWTDVPEGHGDAPPREEGSTWQDRSDPTRPDRTDPSRQPEDSADTEPDEALTGRQEQGAGLNG